MGFPLDRGTLDDGILTTFGHADPAGHWRQRLDSSLAHDINLVIAKAVLGQLAARVPQADIVRQAALFGARNRDGRRQSNGIRRRVARHARSQATPYPARARHSVNAIERLCL